MTGSLLEGKRLLITGITNDKSLAFACAKLAIEQGAEVVLSGEPARLSITTRAARRLPVTPDTVELDVSDPDHFTRVRDELRERWGRLDGVLHSIAFAPQDCLGGGFVDAPWSSVETALRVSAYSLAPLATSMAPLMDGGGSVVALTFDGSLAWAHYDWMGVAKAALEATSRYLARYLGPRGIRVNCVSSGYMRTIAARAIPGADDFTTPWQRRAPLGWDPSDPEPVAGTVGFLFSDLSRMITGEIIHVDGGYHAMGSDMAEPPPAAG